MQDLFTYSLREGVTSMFRDETSVLKLFTVATTVSLEYYPIYSFVPYLTYHFVFRSHDHNNRLSVSLSQAHKKKV